MCPLLAGLAGTDDDSSDDEPTPPTVPGPAYSFPPPAKSNVKSKKKKRQIPPAISASLPLINLELEEGEIADDEIVCLTAKISRITRKTKSFLRNVGKINSNKSPSKPPVLIDLESDGEVVSDGDSVVFFDPGEPGINSH